MTWLDKLFAWWTEFTNSPLGTTLIGILTTLVGVLVIFSKTSLGKKIINGLSKKLDQFGKRVDETLTKVKDIEEYSKGKIQELIDEYEKKLGVLTSYVNDIENLLYQLGDTIPNAKVKYIVDTFKEQKEARLEELRGVVGTYTDFTELRHTAEEIEEEIKTRVLEQVAVFETLYKEKLQELEETIERAKQYGEKENTDEEIETTQD